jgi:hypothetical protein
MANGSALLLRLNPNHWQGWETKIERQKEAWFKLGRIDPNSILPEIPVVVLGTNGIGVVASGSTLRAENISDPDWNQMTDELKEEYREQRNRVLVKLRRENVSLDKLKEIDAIAELQYRRETATWLREDQFLALKTLLPQL